MDAGDERQDAARHLRGEMSDIPPCRQRKRAGATDSVGLILNRGTEAREQMLSKHPESLRLVSGKFQLISDCIKPHTVDLINSLF